MGLENAMVTGYGGYGGNSSVFEELKVIDRCFECNEEITEQDEYYTDELNSYCSVECFCESYGLRKVNEDV